MSEKGLHIVKPGQTLPSLVVEVLFVKEFQSTRARGAGGRAEAIPSILYITTMRGPKGESYVTKSTQFKAEPGAKLIITGVVKGHSVFREYRQTELEHVRTLTDLAALDSIHTPQEILTAVRELVLGTDAPFIHNPLATTSGVFIAGSVWETIKTLLKKGE